MPALNMAVQAQHEHLVKLLLRNQARVDASDRKGVTPLHLATFDGSLDTMKTLISARASVEAQDCHGQTPFFFVPNRRACVVLAEAGADPNVLNYKGQTPLHLAAHAGLNDAVQWLLENMTAKACDLQDKHGRTAVYCAAHSKLKPTILLLQDKGVDTSLRPKKHRGKSVSSASKLLDDMAKK
ncbi:INVS, partial [Symbiodinium necroappetens]